jgi:hypothetical protein
MALKEGSSDKVIQENIECILNKDGCGYDPPYKDPSKEDYTPAQAAAIAYAKAGKRKSKDRKSTASKKTKSVKTSKEKFSEGTMEEQTGESSSPVQSSYTEKTNNASPQIPEGWRSI